jgi:hypothetical protein
MTTWTEYREELEHISATQIAEFNLAMQVRNNYPKDENGYIVRSWEDKSIEITNSIDSKAEKAREAALAALMATPATERGAR